MNPEARILMVPVSSASGIGEYMRCLILADALKARWPSLDIRFLLNRKAPVAATCPYPAQLLDDSPTRAGRAVDRALEALRPQLVIFDCAGRARHARVARQLGARVVFVSQHRRKRAKGFALGRLIALDAHWITQFRFIDGDLNWVERLKLKLLGKPAPTFLGPVYAEAAPELPADFADLQGRRYSLWVAGGGGHLRGGLNATEVFHAAAMEVASPETPAVLVAGANYVGRGLPQHDALRIVQSLSHPLLMTLVAQAAVVVCGGGDLMGQALAMGRNVVAAPLAGDQPARIRACAAHGLIRAAPLSIDGITTETRAALQQPLHPHVAEAGGLGRALLEIRELLGLPAAS